MRTELTKKKPLTFTFIRKKHVTLYAVRIDL